VNDGAEPVDGFGGVRYAVGLHQAVFQSPVRASCTTVTEDAPRTGVGVCGRRPSGTGRASRSAQRVTSEAGGQTDWEKNLALCTPRPTWTVLSMKADPLTNRLNNFRANLLTDRLTN